MIVPGMLVCSNFLISVCMFIVSKATVIVRAGRAIWLYNVFGCGCYFVAECYNNNNNVFI